MDSLYDEDIVLWSEQQAALLRRRAAGELVNDAALDWPNIAEEIESVGSEQRLAVQSHLLQAILHMLKAEAWPYSRDVPHWRAEARLFRSQAFNRYLPSMRQKLDLDRLYAQALRAMPDTIDGQPPLPVPRACPATLDALLGDEDLMFDAERSSGPS